MSAACLVADSGPLIALARLDLLDLRGILSQFSLRRRRYGWRQCVRDIAARTPSLSAQKYEGIRSSRADRNSSQTVMSSRKHRVQLPPLRLHRAAHRDALPASCAHRAVEVNIGIMRTFVQLRRLMDSNRDLARKIEAMEKKYDEQFTVVFDAIKRLVADDQAAKAQPKRRIGFTS
jgi:hypothetical protein